MFDNLLYIIASSVVLIVVILSIHYIVIIPARAMRLKEFIDKENYEDAEILLRDILKREPNNIQALFDLSELYWKTNKLYDAITGYEELLTKNISQQIFKTINFRLACWHRDEDQILLAKEKLDMLLEKDPNNSEYLCTYADISLSDNDYPKAIKLYKKALSIDKQNFHCWKSLGDSYFLQGLFIDAYKAYAYAVGGDSKDPEIWYKIGESCFLSDDHDKALSFYIKTEHFVDSIYSFKATVRIAYIYNIKNIRAQYVQYLEKAKHIIQDRQYLTFDKADVLDIYYQLGEFYLQDNHIDLALNEWEIILKIEPKYRDVSEKFNQYYSARIHDFFKDILISRGEVLTDILVEFVKSVGFTIDSIQYLGEEALDFYVSENSSKWRNSKRRKQIISFWCINEPFPTEIGVKLSNKLHTNDITQIYIVSAGPVLSETRHLLSRKAVDIFDQQNLQEFIHARKEAIKN